MCGGKGCRLKSDTEKPLVEIGGVPMVKRVLSALGESDVDAVYAAVSPHVPHTAESLKSSPVTRIDTPGDGYVEDLTVVLDTLELPVLTVVADLPLVTGKIIDTVLDSHSGGALGVYTPAVVKRQLGASLDLTVDREERELAPTGLNIVGDGTETTYMTHNIRLAVNVNRPEDVQLAEDLI
ncbi:NTP transferase domain-containing protein [Halovenus rubra]|uniref:NTP transferase domain-containing protein n=2 Tax=Halovenus rubra TaxID=869890 RepID=A0ACC7E2K2_9EURY|nr:NTP transferase domain-containing protein [Halovenus rubra]